MDGRETILTVLPQVNVKNDRKDA